MRTVLEQLVLSSILSSCGVLEPRDRVVRVTEKQQRVVIENNDQKIRDPDGIEAIAVGEMQCESMSGLRRVCNYGLVVTNEDGTEYNKYYTCFVDNDSMTCNEIKLYD